MENKELDKIYTEKETPSVEDIIPEQEETPIFDPMNNEIVDEIHVTRGAEDVEIPEGEEVETGDPILVTFDDEIITQKKNRIDFQGYELDNISEADNENDVPSIKQVREIVEEVESEKQDKLTAGDNITITSDNVISATDTTYTAGDNISISDENVISATDTTYTAGDNISISDENVISATDTTYTAGSGITLTDTTFSIGSKAIETGMIDDGAVTNGKIAENAITTTEIADEAITTSKIGDVQVTADKLASNAVTTAKISDTNITMAKIDWTTNSWEAYTTGVTPAQGVIIYENHCAINKKLGLFIVHFDLSLSSGVPTTLVNGLPDPIIGSQYLSNKISGGSDDGKSTVVWKRASGGTIGAGAVSGATSIAISGIYPIATSNT